ncbi:MAG TPA: hypothetical protein DDX54_01715 [Rhodospirillaceae bacterium]|jgi:hypothetical protein|nr:hypothetical protein [Alphaproteobacteria bacterium]HBH26104.1 hypothetical protein [Rhodospirillaceae bacterium]
MSFLDALTPAQQTLLTRLPYRAGLYVSRADATGGEEADAREMAALAGIVEAFATEVFGCETGQHIITQTVARKAEWPRWGDALSNVPEECRRARRLLAGRVDEKEVHGFTGHLLEIAQAVALAYCEYGDRPSLWGRISLMITWYGERARRTRLGALGFATFTHVSPAERRALRALACALEA